MRDRTRFFPTKHVGRSVSGAAAFSIAPATAMAAEPGIAFAPVSFVLIAVALLCTSVLAWRVTRVKREARNRLQRFENMHRVMVNRMQDGLYMVSGEHFVFVNPALAELVGYSVADLMGRSFRDIIAPDSLATVVEHHMRRRDGKMVPNSYETLFLHRDGKTEIPVIMNVDLATMEDGGVVSIGTVKDVTQRVQSEAALRDSEKQLFEAQRIGRIGHWRADPETRAVACSDVFYEILGWDKENVIPTVGKIISSIHPDDRERVNTLRSDAIKRREPYVASSGSFGQMAKFASCVRKRSRNSMQQVNSFRCSA